ncbi:hypothetical protein HT094_13350 [Shewanella sp. ZOR0012]|nr:hypothetical protein [Shewanella sp. ZOR0012]
MEDYKQNPEAVMRAHGLLMKKLTAVMTGDMEKLKTLRRPRTIKPSY